jgi:hypothetical protein
MKLFLAAGLSLFAFAESALPKYGPLSVPLVVDHSFLTEAGHAAPDYWALSSYYESQRSEAACSAAAASMAFNGLLNARRVRGDQDRNVTQEKLLSFVPDWKALTSRAGLRGRHGVTLQQLEDYLKKAAGKLGGKRLSVERYPVNDANAEALAKLREVRSEERRVGKECRRLCRSRWSPYH